MARRRKASDDDSINLGKVALVFIAFALLYFATAYYFGGSVNPDPIALRSKFDPATKTRIFGPLVTEKSNAVVELVVVDGSVKEGWSYVETELLDAKGTSLMSFGGEKYHETGRDSDGPWSEAVRDNDIRLTIPDPGTYFLRVRVEGGDKRSTRSSDRTQQTKIYISADYLRGSNGLYIWVGVLLLIIGVVLNEIRNRTVIGMLGSG